MNHKEYEKIIEQDREFAQRMLQQSELRLKHATEEVAKWKHQTEALTAVYARIHYSGVSVFSGQEGTPPAIGEPT